VIGIVQTNADEFADAPDARADTRLAGHERQRGRVDRAQARKTGVGQRVTS